MQLQKGRFSFHNIICVIRKYRSHMEINRKLFKHVIWFLRSYILVRVTVCVKLCTKNLNLQFCYTFLNKIKMSPKEEYRLTYFHKRGAAELMRVLFVTAGQDYTDERLDTNEWSTRKPGKLLFLLAFCC